MRPIVAVCFSLAPGGFTKMAREALGMVESLGWVGAVEAADAMCKTAHVRLVRAEVTPGALVTIVIRGRLGEVEAAVEAGAQAAARVGKIVARHVIPLPDEQLEESIGGPATGGSPLNYS
jgi:microcompartment protein CcmL/EutN